MNSEAPATFVFYTRVKGWNPELHCAVTVNNAFISIYSLRYLTATTTTTNKQKSSEVGLN